MKKAVILLFFMNLIFASVARAGDKRHLGLFVGAGLSRISAKIIQPDVNATLLGWGNAAEAGLDVPFTNSFGWMLSAEIAEFDLSNTYKAADYLDRTLIRSKGLRSGFFYRNFFVGGGYRMLNIDLKTVSATNGASNATFEGSGSFGFLGFSLDHDELLRGSLELQANSFKLSGLEYTDYQVSLRAYILLSGLLN